MGHYASEMGFDSDSEEKAKRYLAHCKIGSFYDAMTKLKHAARDMRLTADERYNVDNLLSIYFDGKG